MTARFALPVCFLVVLSPTAIAADLDLTRAVVVTPAEPQGTERDSRANADRGSGSAIDDAVGAVREVAGRGNAGASRSGRAEVRQAARRARNPTAARAPPKPEGYQIGVAGPIVWVAGNDAAACYSAWAACCANFASGGRRLRLPADFKEDSAPTTRLRGHQIGYRPKTNSYDAWTVAHVGAIHPRPGRLRHATRSN